MILAHGIGGRADLPLPGELVLQAGGFVVLASFLAVGLAWRRPRFTDPTGRHGRPLPAPVQRLANSAGARTAAQAVLLALLGYLVVQAFTAAADVQDNPAPRALYVLLWVGLVPASLLFGPVWRVVNPLRLVHRLLGAPARWELPKGLGYWPAAAGLAAFVWLELVPSWRAEPVTVGCFVLGYAVCVSAAASVFGAGFFAKGDPFEAYSSLVAAFSPVGRRPADGVLVLRNPVVGLNGLEPAPGLVAVLAVWWGSTAFDGLSGTPWWATVSAGAPVGYASAALAGLVGLVAVSYRLATGRLAPSLVGTLIPIAVGYTIAHYASLGLVEGPRGVGQLVGAQVVVGAPAPWVIATIQVTAILVGHVVGVLAAHDRVLALEPGTDADRRLADQIPLVLLMIVYTMIGLYLLVIA